MKSESCTTCPASTIIAGDPALDFLNSMVISGDTVVESLATGEDFLAWLVQAELIDPGQASAIRANSFPGELDEVAAQARALREWFRRFVIAHMGRHLTAQAQDLLKPLNSVLQRDERYWAIVETSQAATKEQGRSRLELRSLRRCTEPNALILVIAQAMADLVCLQDFSRIKACNGKMSPLLFLDANHQRARRRIAPVMRGASRNE
jgi:predicted RNA-binding Zn ribbon-like protein